MATQIKRSGAMLSVLIFFALSLHACSGGGSDPVGSNDLTDRQSSFFSADTDAAAFAGNDLGAEAPNLESDVESDDVSREIVEADIVELQGTDLYILNQYRGLAVCDISSPDNPSITGRCPIDGDPIEMYVQDDYAYVIGSLPQGSLIRPLGGDIAATTDPPEAVSRVTVVRITDPSNPQIVGSLDLTGRVTDSRIVGDILYVVSSEEPIYYYALEASLENGAVSSELGNDATTSSEWNVYAAAIDLSDAGNPVEVDKVDFGGSARYIHVTEEAIFIASDSFEDIYGSTTITYVDISDASGAVQTRGSLHVPGTVRDEYKMDYADGYFRICTHEWTNEGGLSRLFVIDMSDPDSPVQTGALELGQGEQLFATRFDGNRAYMVTYEMKDPLWVIDLSDPAAPEIKGELVVPGWSTYIQPEGDNLVTLGVDDTNPNGNLVAVSLFNVADPAQPTLTKRVSFGESGGWSWSTASEDVKALTIMEDLGLILLPYTTSSFNDSGGYITENRLQLIDYSPTDLVARGWVTQKGNVLRGRSNQDRLFSVSTEELQVIDASDRDTPQVTADLDLAVNVVDFALLDNGFGAQLSYSDGSYSLQTVSGDDPENVVAEISVTDSGYTGRFVNGNFLYLVSNQYGGVLYGDGVAAETAWQSSTRVTVFDLSTPTAPQMQGSIEIEGSYYTPVPLNAGVEYPYYGGGEIVQVTADLLVFVPSSIYYGMEKDEGLSIVDMSDPNDPTLVTRHSVESQGATGFFGKSGILYYSYSQDSEADVEGRPQVRYYLGRIDLTDPDIPEDLPGINIPGICLGMDATGAIAYTIDNQWTAETDFTVEYTFNAVQIEDDTAYLLGETPLSDYYGHFTIVDDLAYFDGSGWLWGQSNLTIIDLTNPENLATYENELSLWGASVIGAKNRTVFINFSSGIGCYDVQDPGNPEMTDFQYGYGWTRRVVFSDDRAFLPMGYSGVWVKQL